VTKAPPLMGQTPNTMYSYCLRRARYPDHHTQTQPEWQARTSRHQRLTHDGAAQGGSCSGSCRSWQSPRSITVRARPQRLRALSVSHCKSVLYGAFVWARQALNIPKRRCLTWAVTLAPPEEEDDDDLLGPTAIRQVRSAGRDDFTMVNGYLVAFYPRKHFIIVNWD
jgi:hypothetical protein